LKFALLLPLGLLAQPKQRSTWEDRQLNQENHPVSASLRDAELIARAQNGEESAFEALFHVYKRRIYLLCLRMIGNAAEAEELMQEAFLQLFRKIKTFRGEAAFSTWLHRVAMNISLMRLRKRKLKNISMENGDDHDKEDRPERQYGSVDLSLTGLVDRVSLEVAIAKLPQGYKRVFELHDVLGYEHNEIAEMLGFSVGNSKSQLHKARLRLRKLLGAGFRKNTRSNEPQETQDVARSFDDSPPASTGSSLSLAVPVACFEGEA
jgi:RNA polymerase sigma-70 factor, ECF subfamily